MWTHPKAKIHYCPSDMILNDHSNALYLSAPHAHSHAGGYFVLGSLPWLGNPFGILQNSVINLIPDLLNSGIFIGILFF
jgi:hypothetical protein